MNGSFLSVPTPHVNVQTYNGPIVRRSLARSLGTELTKEGTMRSARIQWEDTDI